MTKPELTAERLRSLLNYDPETGVFTWAVSRSRAPLGGVAGCAHGDGYRRIEVDGRAYYAHRLAWLHTHGEWPGELDHINGDRSANGIKNLRPATRAGNSQNKRKARSDSRTGVIGVSPHGAGYKAEITTNGVWNYLGVFPSVEAASLAYLTAKRQQHATCTI